MDSLYDELCVMGHDEFIKTTTIYPLFVNTNPELLEYLSSDIPLATPDKIAEETVKGILTNQRNIFFPKFAKFSIVLK